MTNPVRTVQRAAVIGAGTMGAGIAALLASAGVHVDLLDIVPDALTQAEASEGLGISNPRVRNRIADSGWARVRAAKPASDISPETAARVSVGNLEDDLDRLGQADWIIEAVYEGRAASFINELIAGRSVHPLEFYTARADELMIPLSLFVALASFVVSIVIRQFLEERQHPELASPNLGVLLIFLACYITCALILQVTSDLPPWKAQAPVEFFTMGLLWMLCLVSLSNAYRSSRSRLRMFFWLVSCVALAALAVDEILEFHETKALILGEDDPFKVIIWLIGGAALYWICSRKDAPSRTRRACIVGYLIHSLYILVELGDGNYFELPILSKSTLTWLEEIFELFFSGV